MRGLGAMLLPAVFWAAFWAAACSQDPGALIAPSQIVGDAIPQPLAGLVGEASRGATLFVDREGAHCVLCHAIDGLDAEFQGNLGPTLTAVGARLNPGQIRLRIVEIERVAPGSVMPAYYRVRGLNQVAPAYAGQPVLDAQQVEDLVAYLSAQQGTDDAG